jgi:hypothetical protein
MGYAAWWVPLDCFGELSAVRGDGKISLDLRPDADSTDPNSDGYVD